MAARQIELCLCFEALCRKRSCRTRPRLLRPIRIFCVERFAVAGDAMTSAQLWTMPSRWANFYGHSYDEACAMAPPGSIEAYDVWLANLFGQASAAAQPRALRETELMQNVSASASPSPALSGVIIRDPGVPEINSRSATMRTTTCHGARCLAVLPAGALAMDSHMAVQPNALKWGPGTSLACRQAPQVAVVAGDPSQDGPYVIRAKLPSGYKIPPHYPSDRRKRDGSVRHFPHRHGRHARHQRKAKR